MEGDLEVMQKLIAAGADLSIQKDVYGDALHLASIYGYEGTVESFLAAGTDVNAQTGDYHTALQAASALGHEKVVKMLIAAGADVNAQGGEYGNALQVASSRGREGIVWTLINAGADVNAAVGPYGHALLAAVGSSQGPGGHVAKLPTSAGAEIEYDNKLQAVSCRGDVELVQVLLNPGTDVNAPAGL